MFRRFIDGSVHQIAKGLNVRILGVNPHRVLRLQPLIILLAIPSLSFKPFPGTAGLDIVGSGMLHATMNTATNQDACSPTLGNQCVTFNFPEPSSLILMLI